MSYEEGNVCRVYPTENPGIFSFVNPVTTSSSSYPVTSGYLKNDPVKFYESQVHIEEPVYERRSRIPCPHQKETEYYLVKRRSPFPPRSTEFRYRGGEYCHILPESDDHHHHPPPHKRTSSNECDQVSCGEIAQNVCGCLLYGAACLVATSVGAIVKCVQAICYDCANLDTDDTNQCAQQLQQERECHHSNDWDVIVYRRRRPKKGLCGL